MRNTRALLGSALLMASLCVQAQVRWPLDPAAAPYAFDHNIGGYQGEEGFHGGIDVPAEAGTDVYPVVGGRVCNVKSFPCTATAGVTTIRLEDIRGYIAISPSNECIDAEKWLMMHICDIRHPDGSPVRRGDTVDPAFAIAKVAHFPATANAKGIRDHVHMEKLTGVRTLNSIINPLAELQPPLELKPEIHKVLFKKERRDPVAPASSDDFPEKINDWKVIAGNLDIVVHATTEVTAPGTPPLPKRAEINAIGHRVDGMFNVSGRRRPERFLFDFSIPARNYRDTAKLGLVYDETQLPSPDGMFYFNRFTITNCGGSSALDIRASLRDAIGNVMPNAWQTKVHAGENDSNAMETPDPAAAFNAEAKYPDGPWDVTIIAHAYGGPERRLVVPVYINNFEQIIKPEQTTYKATETVYVTGSGFLGNTKYTVYLVAREKWGTEREDGAAMPPPKFVTSVEVTTTAGGTIERTELWGSYVLNGTPDKGYDIVVDYDGDGKYHTKRMGRSVDALNQIVCR